MIIAIDYDGTYSVVPELWNQVITLFIEAGHSVICITGRTEQLGQSVLDSIGKLVPVIFAGKEWKRDAALKKGWKVDVWIDDTPETVGKQFLINIGCPSNG